MHRTARPADGNAAPQRRSYDEGVSTEVCNTLTKHTEAEILKKLGRLQEHEVDACHAADERMMENCGGEISRLLRERG